MDRAAFSALYGPWAGLAPTEVAVLLARFDRPWWIAGGWAIEAATGVTREHEDVDVGFFRSDLAVLRRALAPRHLWSAGSGMLRPVTDEVPDLHAESDQVWVRDDAGSPWLFDGLATPGDVDGWVNRRDPAMVLPLAGATWERDGIRYLNPELVLLFKAKQARAKDEVDLAAALPRLGLERRRWLAAAIERLHPGHPWTATIAP